jgi:hypothetical protein
MAHRASLAPFLSALPAPTQAKRLTGSIGTGIPIRGTVGEANRAGIRQRRKSNAFMNSLTRRDSIKRTSIAAGTAALVFQYVGNVLGANDRINGACIGVG